MNKELEIGMPIFVSADAREGVRAFKEKRKADFKGK
jgi:enoyl-CoA hydratase/carnithine racemase